MSSSSISTASRTDFAARQDALRVRLAQDGLDGFIIPVADEYQSEYPPRSARRVGWLTGFTGSAGLAVVLVEEAMDPAKVAGNPNARAAAVFIDGRYTLQAEQQVDGARYERVDLGGDPQGGSWVVSRLKSGAVLGYDPWMHTQAAIENLKDKLAKAEIRLKPVADNPVDAVWHDRPAVPKAPVMAYSEALAGESSAAKRTRIGAALAKNGADAAIITAPDSIAWLLNIRGGDVPHTPVALSYAILHKNGAVDWLIDPDKLSPEVLRHVGPDVQVRDVRETGTVINGLGSAGKTVQYDPRRSAAWFQAALDASGAKIISGDDPCLLPKALKNAIEIEGIRQAHLRDGVALTKFLAWLDGEVMRQPVTELGAEEKLLDFRRCQDRFHDVSFDTIAGSGAHGAIVHYRATEDSNKILENNNLFLLDSGAQYLDGTTDVTRTIAIGTPTQEQRKRFTQVLQGHIGIAGIIFPKGVTGQQLDVLARAPLWAETEDYAHGTGHGVGAFLGVHEGPQGLHRRSDVTLLPGMVVSNEPGYYKTGEYGIRTENLIVVREVPGTGGDSGKPTYLYFETLTLAPIDLRLVALDMLSERERKWLNHYHRQVFDRLSPYMDSHEKTWLATATREV